VKPTALKRSAGCRVGAIEQPKSKPSRCTSHPLIHLRVTAAIRAAEATTIAVAMNVTTRIWEKTNRNVG
jgi:hypothetical protein